MGKQRPLIRIWADLHGFTTRQIAQAGLAPQKMTPEKGRKFLVLMDNSKLSLHPHPQFAITLPSKSKTFGALWEKHT